MENHRLSAIEEKIASTMRKVYDLTKNKQHRKGVLLLLELLKEVWPHLSDSFSQQALEQENIIISFLIGSVPFIEEAEFLELGLTSVCSNRLQLLQRLLNAYSYNSHLLITWGLVKFWNGVINKVTHEELTSILDKVRSDIKMNSFFMSSGSCTISRFSLSQKQKKKFIKSSVQFSFQELDYFKDQIVENKTGFFNLYYTACMICDVEGKDDFLFHWKKEKNADKILNILYTIRERLGYNTKDCFDVVELLDNLNSTQKKESRTIMKRLCRSNVNKQIRLWWLDILCDTSMNQPSESGSLSVQLSIDDSVTTKETIIYHSKLDLNYGLIHNDELSDYFKMKKKRVPQVQIALVDGTNMIKDKWYHARTYKYLPRDNTWQYSPAIIKMISKVNLGTNQKGLFRDLYKFLVVDREETVAAKRYRGVNNHRVWKYTADVRCQTFGHYYSNLFTEKYGDKYDVVVVQASFYVVFEDATCKKVVDFFNAELHAPSDWEFQKYTNNGSFVTKKTNSELATAFGHFTFLESEHKLVVVDLQGWSVPKEDGTEYLCLTDPAIHAPMWEWTDFVGGNTNGGDEGIHIFWTKQHAKCNKICKELGLKRPANY